MQNGKQMRFSVEELALMKALFSENDQALKLLRKIFLPELSPDTPIGQNIDLWMTVKIDEMSASDAIINIKARNTLITHLDQCLMQLSVLAGQKTETAEETKARLETNSTK